VKESKHEPESAREGRGAAPLLGHFVVSIAFFIGKANWEGVCDRRDAVQYKPNACKVAARGIPGNIDDAIKCLREAVWLSENSRVPYRMRLRDRLLSFLFRRLLLQALARLEHERNQPYSEVDLWIGRMCQEARKRQEESICGCGRCRTDDARKQAESFAKMLRRSCEFDEVNDVCMPNDKAETPATRDARKP